jgi:hypothetical protein
MALPAFPSICFLNCSPPKHQARLIVFHPSASLPTPTLFHPLLELLATWSGMPSDAVRTQQFELMAMRK